MNWNEGNTFILNDFDDNMEASLVLPLIQEVKRQSRYRDGFIDLHINSFGGYAHLVFHMISQIELAKRNNVVVRTIVPDIAYSAGSILAITGTPGERYIEKSANHLIHYGTTGSVETTPEQVERNTAKKTAHFKRIKQHYLQYTKIPAAELDALMNDDSAFISGPNCVKKGLADKHLDKFELFPTL